MSGRVIDPEGEPVAGAFVGLEVYDYASRVPGQRTMKALGPPGEPGRADISNCRFALAFEFGPDDPENATRCEERALAAGLGRAITNEDGEWRLSGLTPGEYVVVVAPDRDTLDWGRADADGWLPVYYPGTPDPDLAEPVRVTSPAEYTGIEIGWDRFAPVRIAGSIIGLPDSARIEERFGPFDVSLWVAAPDGQAAPTLGASTTRSGTTGTFEVEVLPFHEYVLTAQVTNRYTGRVRVNVRDSDVVNVTLPIALPLSNPGQFVFDPPVSREAAEEVSLRFSARYAEGGMGQTSHVGQDGRFEVSQLPGWDFLIEIEGLPEGYYVDTASFGRVDPLRDLFNPTDAPGSTLLIRAASTSGRIIGISTGGSSQTPTDSSSWRRSGPAPTASSRGNRSLRMPSGTRSS